MLKIDYILFDCFLAVLLVNIPALIPAPWAFLQFVQLEARSRLGDVGAMGNMEVS